MDRVIYDRVIRNLVIRSSGHLKILLELRAALIVPSDFFRIGVTIETTYRCFSAFLQERPPKSVQMTRSPDHPILNPVSLCLRGDSPFIILD